MTSVSTFASEVILCRDGHIRYVHNMTAYWMLLHFSAVQQLLGRCVAMPSDHVMLNAKAKRHNIPFSHFRF